ncbi:MAG: ATP-binding protein [Parasphingorhabdus sp.]|nr:ATP-binding protein [Parasphingorhabdus sp.]
MNWFSNIFKRRRDAGAFNEGEAVPSPVRIPFIPRKQTVDEGLPHFQNLVGTLEGGRRSSAIDRIRAKLRDAFTPSHPVSDVRMFAGREVPLRTLIRAIEDQQLHVVVFGDRGIGKTSTLHVLRQLAVSARYTVCYNSCGIGTSFSDMFRTAASDIPLLFHESFDPTDPKIEARASLADILPEGELGVGQITEILSKVRGTRILIILDEFDRADSQKFREQVAELIKNLSDRAVPVQIIIAGVAANLTELIAHIPSVRRNIVGLPIHAMAAEEVSELVHNGEEVSGLTFSEDAVNSVVAIANGSPYLANLVGQHAGLAATAREAADVGLEDIAVALNEAMEEVRLRISPRSLQLVDTAIAAGRLTELGALASASMTHAGQIPAGIAKTIKASDGLVAPLEDDPNGGWSFVEDGVVPYVWLRSRAAATG